MLKPSLFLALFLSLLALDSKAASLSDLSDLNGTTWVAQPSDRKVLLYFWASWCTDCKEKMRTDLIELKKKQPHLAILLVNVDQDLDRAKHVIDKESIKLPVLRDENKNLRKMLKVFSVPHWAVFNKNLKQSGWQLVDTAPAYEWSRVSAALGRGE